MTIPLQNREIQPARRVIGELRLPGDKSISHRLAMLAGIARGRSVIRNFLRSDDCMRTLAAIQALGARAEFIGDELVIEGTAGRLLAPVRPLDLGNSGTAIRLLTGLIAGHPIEAVLTGDASLRSRPMRRIQEPLVQMGAEVTLEDGEHAPIRVRGGQLRGITYEMPVASAQVKSCILLAGLRAEGTTRVIEPLPTRDHTERLLHAMGWSIRTSERIVELDGAPGTSFTVPANEWTVPGDISSAAFWFVAAAVREGNRVTVRGVGLNPRRTAVLDVLRRMGAQIQVEACSDANEAWEPVGNVTVVGARLRGTEIGGEEIPRLIDEIPILAVAAAMADGETVIRDAAELRVKESNRIATVVKGLRLFGVPAEERPDGMVIGGGGVRQAASAVPSYGDHRIAMSFAVLSLYAPKPCVIQDVTWVDTSYPGFWNDLQHLTQERA